MTTINRWRFFDRSDRLKLYPKIGSSHYHIDAFHPDLDEYPLLASAKMYKAIQNPGDLIFVPAGNPHAVSNIKDSVGIAMNYVDTSNFWDHLFKLATDHAS